MLVTLNEVLKKAQEEHYGVGLFNTIDTDMLEAVISAAEELRAPVIIGPSEVILHAGELQLMAPAMIEAAKRATVPVVVHFDHGFSFDYCMEALKLGFPSVMFDGSSSDYEKNVADTREVVKIAHSFGASVEGEIGHVGQAKTEDNLITDMYTTPEEAVAFCEATGVDALAVAIGTAHGEYKTKPQLNIERLKQIRKATDVPLVLHGGSGLSDDDFKTTVREGITKVNIYTDLCLAAKEAMREGIEKDMSYLDIRNFKVEKMKEAVKEKILLFGSNGKA